MPVHRAGDLVTCNPLPGRPTFARSSLGRVGLPNQRSPANQPGRIVKSILAKSYLVSNATV